LNPFAAAEHPVGDVPRQMLLRMVGLRAVHMESLLLHSLKLKLL
jgi:hypothetical protein